MEITRQSDQFGLPEQPRPEIPAEDKLASVLARPSLFQGPSRVEVRD